MNADANVRTAEQAIAILRHPGDSTRERLIAAGVVLAAQYERLHQTLLEERARGRRLHGQPSPYPEHLRP